MTDQFDLKRLPRATASDDFAADVLRRVRADRARRRATRPRLAAVAAAVVALSAAAGAWWARQSATAEPATVTAESLEQLRSEVRELNRELDSFLRLAEDTQPFVPVSIDPRTEVLFDLRDIEPLPVSLASAGSRAIQ